MLIKRKPPTDQKLIFPKMGAKPVKKKPAAKIVNQPDIENAADAKLPGDKKEDAADLKKPVIGKKKTKNKGKSAAFAQKAALALVSTK